MSTAQTFLRKVPLFAGLPEEDMQRLCQMVEEIHLRAGEVLFHEGSLGDRIFVIKEGQVEITKRSGERTVQLAIRQAGEVIGELALLEAGPRNASGTALTDCVCYAITHEQFEELLNSSPSAARTILQTVIGRLRSTELLLTQSDKMAQLGTLTAGIAHELNNPAAAAGRGAEQLKKCLAELQALSGQLLALQLTPAQAGALAELVQPRQPEAGQGAEAGLMARSDRESELEDWLEGVGVEQAWEIAPALAEQGYQPRQLADLLAGFPPGSLPLLTRWLAVNATLYQVLQEIGQGTGRILEIVKALRSYVYLDQAPVQEVDIHEGLENTLVVLRHKLKSGVEVQREYEPGLPRILAYASELNQVWTNILDNAIDAMQGQGKITIRTRHNDPWVVIDIADTGPGIAPEVQEKIFQPFFTTKAIGQGTGLGLSISYNIVHKHGGEIRVDTRPGETHFEIWLPRDFEDLRKGRSLAPIHRGNDGALRDLLETTRTVAVVGLSNKPDRPAHTVPAYLQQQGYRIIPVNPTLSEALGEKAYSDLAAVPEPVDVVLIFRRSEDVPPVVEQAIQVKAKAVWMQEGIVNETAAQQASQAGLEVVMDACMRETHKAIFKQPGPQAPKGGE